MAQLKTTNVHGDLHVSGDITQEGNKVYHEGNFNPDSKQDKLTAGTNISISGDTISATNTTYSTGTLTQLQAGTETTGRLQTAKNLSDWLNSKGYVTTDTKYTAGNGLTLSGTSFSLPVTVSGSGTYVQSVTQNTNGITVTLGTPPNTNTTYSTGTLAQLNTGTDTAGRLHTAKNLNDWINAKGFKDKNPTWAEVTGKPATFPPTIGTTSTTAKAGNWMPTWANVSGKPTTFAPSAHNHSWSNITSGIPATASRWPTWSEVTSKPSTFSPSSHTHPVSQITGLGSAATRDVGVSSGNVLEVGAFGLGGEAVTVSGNWNLYISTGFYKGVGLYNPPWEGWAYVQAIKHNDQYATQVAYTLDENPPRMALRSFVAGSWTSWQDVFSSGNHPDFSPPSQGGEVGTYAFVRSLAPNEASWGDVVSGNDLTTASLSPSGGHTYGVLHGSWRVMGSKVTSSLATLAMRIA